MNNTELVVVHEAAPVSPTDLLPAVQSQIPPLARLIAIKARGKHWITTYEVPGRKMLRDIVGEAYGVFISIKVQSEFDFLSKWLRGEKVRLHADAPNSAIVIRVVFPMLDPSRVSKYARAMDAAKQKNISADKFADFIVESGGFEKIRLSPVVVIVPGKPAKAATPDEAREVVPYVEEEEVDDLNEDEMDDLEFGDELHELLQQRKASPFIAIHELTDEQRARIDQSVPERLVLIAEIHEGQLRIFDQIPFVEEAIARAYRQRYPTCKDLREARN